MAFKIKEEKYVPVSDWGRDQKKYNDNLMRQALIVVRTPKLRKPRIYISTYVPNQCSKCPGTVRTHNKSGICSKCCSTKVRKELKIGPRPTCKECNVPIMRTNTRGLCKLHKKRLTTYAYCACGAQMSLRNASGICKTCQSTAVGPNGNCAVCSKRLHGTNKTGLCEKHGRSARQMAYMARRKAA